MSPQITMPKTRGGLSRMGQLLATLKLVSIGIVLILGTSSITFADEAQEEFEGQEFLFMTEEAYTQEKGQWQLSFSTQYMDRKTTKEGDEVKIKDQWQWIMEAEYGLSDWFQVSLEVPFASVHKKTMEDNETTDFNKAGIGDLETAIRLRLLEEDASKWWSPTATIGFELTWPTGHWRRDLGTDRFGWEGNLSLSKTVDKWAYHLTGGFGMTNDAKEQGESDTVDIEEFELSGALVHSPTDRWDIICELSAEFETEDSGSSRNHEVEFYITPGVKYELFEDFAIGMAAPVGLTDESYDWGIMIKLQYEW